MTAPNAELAYEVLDQIDAHPQQWRQGTWIGKAACGTVACFAGWTLLLSGILVDDHDDVVDGPPELIGKNIPDAADALLGISTALIEDLKLGDPYEGLLTREELGEIVAGIFGPRPDGAS